MTDEIWCPVHGFESLYVVSNLGRVKRVAGSPGARTDRILKPRPDKDGYFRVLLHREGVRYARRVHKLVALAFHGAS
jgi:hypothetical protein